MTPRHLVPLLVLCALAGCFLPASAAAPIGPGTFSQKPVVVEHKTFDPRDPPPQLPPGELAICVGNSTCEASFGSETLYTRKAATGDSYEAAVKVPWVHLNIAMEITVWLPQNAPDWLKEHEEGHRQIFETVYATAGKAALNAAKNSSGRTFLGTGRSTFEAEKNALAQAQKTITDDYTTHACAVWARVNDIYDQLTAHGMASIPNREHPVEVPTAITEAFEQYAAEVAAASQPAATKPDLPTGKK